MSVPERDRDPPGAMRLRLTGEMAGQRRTFLLQPGSRSVGSSRANDVVLPVPGVSRRHATLEVGPAGIEVLDAGSKNGTFLDGRRVVGGAVGPGGVLRFGPVELRVELVAREDATVAIAGPRSATPEPPRGPAEEPATAHLPAFDPATLQRWLAAVEAALRPARRPSPGLLGTRLAEVADELGAEWAALIEQERSGEARLRVLGAWGAPREGGLERALEAASSELRQRGAGGGFGCSLGGSPGVFYLERTPRGKLRGLAFGGSLPAREESEPLLRLLLHALGPADERDAPEPISRIGDSIDLRFPPGYVVGHAPSMRELYRHLAAVSGSSAPILIVGETGAGKEPIARTVHQSSPRLRERFVALNCAAIPRDLLEAELFGVAPGAATGVAERPGLFLAADRGTLLLDEIGEMPLLLQAKLLRAIENGEVSRVGGELQRVDVRIIAATNVDLSEQVTRGAFRADLYYRIAAHVVRVPPLRERRQDLPALVEHLLERAVAERGRRIAGVAAAALDTLIAYPWPGNVRELENEVRRLVAACPDGALIDSTMISETVRAGGAPRGVGSGRGIGYDDAGSLQDRLDALERRLIVAALTEAAGNRSRAAERLGIHRNSLAAKLDRLGIDPGRLPDLPSIS